VEQLEVKEVVNIALRSMKVLEIKAEDRVTHQVNQIIEAIQQLQQRIVDLELCIVPETPQDVRDQREENYQSTVERIKALTMECKKLTDHSAQTYEKITENLKALESQLQEVKYQEKKIQAQLKSLSFMERMKRSQEKHTAQKQIHTIQSRFMEVTEKLQPIQDKAYKLFTQVEGQGVEIEQVFTTYEQRLEGPINDALIQYFTQEEAIA
jgi:predicted  nucleic acid-binding Zn-ribbon protein